MATVFTIYPYRANDTWVFDDDRVGLRAEPFVSGIPELIVHAVRSVTKPDVGFALQFSDRPFPKATLQLRRTRLDREGAWYLEGSSNLEGWLCSAICLYFGHPPEAIYARVENLN